MTEPCRIGFAEDFLLADGTAAFPGYDLGPLRETRGLKVVRVPAGPRHASAIQALDVLVSVPSTAALDGATFADQPRLAAVVRVGVGCDDVDLSAATAAGVAVVVPSEAVRRPTAVAALTLILALATRLVEKDRLSRAGPAAWHERAALRGRGLDGRVLGLVGCGSIGSELATLVKPLGMRVIACDPALDAGEAARIDVETAGLEAVLAAADFVSIHCPLTPETRHLINAVRLARMRPDAFLINTARGGVVDQAALVAALAAGRLAGAGLDVFEPEPLDPDDPLLALDTVILSAHALNWTEDLDADLAAMNVAAIFALLEGRTPERVMNPEALEAPLFRAKLRALAARFAAARQENPACA